MAFLPNRSLSLKGSTDSSVSALRVLWNQYSENPVIYSLGIFSVILTDFTEVAMPQIVKRAIDFFSNSDAVLNIASGSGQTEKWSAYTQIFWTLMSLFAIQFFGRVFWRLYLAQQTHYVAAKLKSRLWSHTRWLPRFKLDRELSTGELMSISAGDVGIARNIFGFTLVTTIDTIFILVFCLFAMFSLDVELTLWSLVLLPILPVLLTRLAKKEAAEHKNAQESLSRLSEIAAQSVSTLRLQRVTDSEIFWQNKLESAANDYRQKRMRVLKTSFAFIPLTGIPPLIAYGVLLGLGIKKVVAGDLSLGAFVALQSYIFMVQGPMFEMGVQISEWQRSLASLRRVLGVLREKPDSSLLLPGKISLNQIDLNSNAQPLIQVKNLHFAYPEKTERLVIRDLNFALAAGERLGVMGPVGSGKTTLLQILSGFERDFLGEVRLCGHDVRDFSHTELRSVIGFVPQKPFLFATTVRENLKLDLEVSDEQIWKALNLAGLEEDVRGFPQDLNTPLGEWGINLSGGQKQRLTLARALLRRPKILLLDDCLSAVDTVTEEKILHNLDDYFSDTTLIWVAHRSSTLRFCDIQITLTDSNNSKGIEVSRGIS